MIRAILNLYILVLVVDAILSYLPQFKNHIWAQKIKQAADFTLVPMRRVLPRDLPFDVSPIAVILLIKLFEILF